MDRNDEELRVRSSRLKTETEQRKTQLGTSERRQKDLDDEAAACAVSMQEAEGELASLAAQIADITSGINERKEQIIRS